MACSSSSSSSLTSFLSKPPKPSSLFLPNFTPSHLPSFIHLPKHPSSSSSSYKNKGLTIKASTAATPNQQQQQQQSQQSTTSKKNEQRVQRVHSMEEFDTALRSAHNRLVVVEFAKRDSEPSSQIYPFMVELSRTCNDVEFILVMGDESDATRALCSREKIDQVPHFSFYKSMVKIHEEDAIGPDQLVGDVLYYGDSHSAVAQLHSRGDVERLIDEHRGDGKLIVLDVGLKHCGPCVKVYPTVIKLSRQMDTVVFARMNGDENESCMEFLRDMNVIEVPTFVFIRDGEIKGRYVGSGKGELIGEILRYQGVRVTY